MTGAPLLKWLVAFCALGSVAVDASELGAIPASMTTGGHDNWNANPFLVTPYCMPGAACWPKPEVWSAFNQSIGGMLHGPPGRSPSSRVLAQPLAWLGCRDLRRGRRTYPYPCRPLSPLHTGLSTSLIAEQCVAAGNDGTLLAEQGWGICMAHLACYYEGCMQERPPNLPTYSVEALTVEHVQAAVRFANEHNIAISIKTSGHNYAGSSTARGSLLIWLKNLRRFGEFGPLTDSCGTTHPLTQHLGGGEAWGDAYKAAVNNGYTVVGGGSANVGCCGGWLAGSGLSWTTRNNGFGLDNVLQYEVVTADGERKIVDACSEPDLYWALRGGGGGSFGVVTSLYYRAFPKTPVVNVRATPRSRIVDCSTLVLPPTPPHSFIRAVSMRR